MLYFGYDRVLNLTCSVAMLLMSAWKTVWHCLAAGIQMVYHNLLPWELVCLMGFS